MDRRNATHLKGKKLESFLKKYLKEKKEVQRMKKEIATHDSWKMKREYELNSLWLARTSIDESNNRDISVIHCDGCPNCEKHSDECFIVIVNK